MTRSTTRIAGIGAGALLALGIFSAAPAGAADGAQADATVNVETAEAINQTLGLVNQACTDVTRVGSAATSTLASEHGISVSAQPAGGLLNLQVSLPALTDSLPSLGSLPLLGSVAGQVDATEPLKVTCAATADGTGLGLSAAGVDVLVDAIAPGVDVSGLDLAIPVVDAGASATTSGVAVPGTSVSATAAGSLPATKAKAAPSARVSAAAPATTATTAAAVDADPAATSSSPSVSAGTLARTGAGVGALGLLGSTLIGGGRLVAFGRKLLRIG
jgi:trimeric autotransporter adhesin